MPRYAIADWLTDDLRAAICQARYTKPHTMARRALADDAYCPFGVPYRDGLIDYCAGPSAPDGKAIALALVRWLDDRNDPRVADRQDWERLIDEIEAAAQAFVDAWDAGRIQPSDLPTVLGYAVAPPRGSEREA